MVLAVRHYRAGLCSGCGMHRDDTVGEHNHGRHDTRLERCDACRAIDTARHDQQARQEHLRSQGLSTRGDGGLLIVPVDLDNQPPLESG